MSPLSWRPSIHSRVDDSRPGTCPRLVTRIDMLWPRVRSSTALTIDAKIFDIANCDTGHAGATEVTRSERFREHRGHILELTDGRLDVRTRLRTHEQLSLLLKPGTRSWRWRSRRYPR